MDRHPGLHVRRTAAAQTLTVDARRDIAGDRNGVQVPGERDTLGPSGRCAGHDDVAVALDGQRRILPKGRLDQVGEVGLVARDRFDVDQRGGEGRPSRPDQARARYRHAHLGTRTARHVALGVVPDRMAWGYGLATTWLGGSRPGARHLVPGAGPRRHTESAASPHELSSLTGSQEGVGDRGVHLDVVLREIDLDAPPVDTPDAYLRLHLLSHRLVAPHGVNLDGIFGVLPNVVWT